MTKKIDTKRKTQKIFLIDSFGWIEYFSDGKKSKEYAEYIEKANPQNYISPTIVLYEVYKKILSVYNEEKAMEAAAHIKYATKLIDFSDNLAISAAETSFKHKLPMADAIILTTAKNQNASVITSDKHFKGFDSVIFI
ncbi:MAG: type II toxin-antitoxin system VapC family toxin [Candidatus Thorarchaeota archaeon]